MTIAEAQWSPAKHLILGDDPQARVYADTALWFKKIKLFREGEGERMIGRIPTPEDLQVHRDLLQRLIADGDHLLLLIRQVGLPEHVADFTADDVAAAIETLQDTYRGWHEPMLPDQRAQILREVFPDVS